MTLSVKTRLFWRDFFAIVLGFVLIGWIFWLFVALVVYAFDLVEQHPIPNEPFSIGSLTVEGFAAIAVAAARMGVAVALIELFIVPRFERRLTFVWAFALRIALYMVCIGFMLITFAVPLFMSISGESLGGVWGNEIFQTVILRQRLMLGFTIGMVAAFAISVFRLVSRKFGRGILWQYLTGKYHAPREETRILMFCDLKDSTTIAEKLGHVRYHYFLNDLFADVSDAVLETGGEIYQYVGDEVVMTWRSGSAAQNRRSATCYFLIAEAIHSKRETYLKRFGVAPVMKAGLHAGTVITGEIGSLKSEIVFHGDAVNTAARIQEQCNVLKSMLLVSADWLHQTQLSNEHASPFTIKPCGKVALKGKAEAIDLFRVSAD